MILRRTLAAAALAASLGAPPALAQEKAPDELAREGIGKIVSALEMLMMSIPTYEMPEVLPNGDIIIRRRNPIPPDDQEPNWRSDDDMLDALDDGKPI